MKKTLLLLSAIALVGIASCNKAEQNPNYTAATDEVLTQFVLSVSAGETPQTKMTAENVQKDNFNFLGMQDAKLFTFQTSDVTPVYVTNESVAKKDFDLGKLYASGTVDHAANQTNRIIQLTIPLGVNSVLLYGKAVNDVPAAVANTIYSNDPVRQNMAKRGSTTISVSDMANTHFDANRRMSTDQLISDYDATGRLMIYVINTIISSSVNASTEAVDGYSNLPALSWRDLGHKYILDNWSDLNIPASAFTRATIEAGFDADAAGFVVGGVERSLLPLEEVLGRTYYLFTTITTGDAHAGEYRAGSSKAVKSMMESMSSMIIKAVSATPTSAEEANAKRLADMIRSNMTKFFESDWTYKTVSTIQSVINDSTLWNDATNGFVGAQNLNEYPYGDFGIPEGAAQLAFSHDTDKFSYMRPNKALVNPNADNYDPRKYVFPAELMYYVNSGLRLTDEEVSASDFPNGVTPWVSGVQDPDATTPVNLWDAKNWVADAAVTSSTHGVAVRDNINYGVALLKTSVEWASSASAGLDDNRAAFGSTTQTFDIDDMNLELHGILVGGINPRFDWQYLATPRTGGAEGQYGTFDGVIYDDQIVDAGIPTDTGKETYTLVYDNYNRDAAATAQNDVYVTLEFINNGDPFYGRDNVIPTGGTFYLVGKLEANTVQSATNPNGHVEDAIVWDANYQVPPTYGVTKKTSGDIIAAASGTNTAGKSIQIPRVFIQNYMTTAVFKICHNSLKSAYYSVPDLKSAQLSVGLSVDISWKDGYTYDIEF